MAVRNILPTSQLTGDDIRDTLNANGGSVTNDCLTFFKAVANINPWSRHKPVPLQTDQCQDFNSSLPFYNATWWKGYNGMCGFVIPVFDGVGTPNSGFLSTIMSDYSKWSYDSPGGGLYPFRLGDFANYYPNAINPISAQSTYDLFINSLGSINLSLEMAVPPNDPHNLSLQDFVITGIPLTEWYLGICLHTTTSNYMLSTSTSKLGNSLNLELKNMQPFVGSWKASFFLSTAQFFNISTIPTSKFICLDLPHSIVNIKMSGSLYRVYALGAWNSSNTMITYDIYLENNSSGGNTLFNSKIYLVRTTGVQKPENGEVVLTESVGDVFVNAGKTVIYKDNTFNHRRVAGYTYWLGANATSATTVYNQIENIG